MQSSTHYIDILREKRAYLSNEFGVLRIGLFGSFATDSANESSDIDLVIEFAHPVGWRFIDCVEYLEHILGRHVDVLTPSGVENIRVKQVARGIEQSIIYV